MKILSFFIVIFTLISCGVSKGEYQNLVNENEQLKSQISSLIDELDQFKNGKDRTIALIEKAYNENNIVEARRNINTFLEYHPESKNEPNFSRIVTLVEREEIKIKQAEEAAERERIRQERLANIGKVADNPIQINGNWRKISQVITDIIINRDNYDGKYIYLSNITFDSFNVDSDSYKVRGFDWVNNNDTYSFLLTTNAFANELTSNKFRIYFQPNNNDSKKYFLQINGKYMQPSKRMSMKGRYFYYNDRNNDKQNVLIIYELQLDGRTYSGNLP